MQDIVVEQLKLPGSTVCDDEPVSDAKPSEPCAKVQDMGTLLFQRDEEMRKGGNDSDSDRCHGQNTSCSDDDFP